MCIAQPPIRFLKYRVFYNFFAVFQSFQKFIQKTPNEKKKNFKNLIGVIMLLERDV